MDIITKFDIDAPVDTAWQLLGEEFGDVSWSDLVIASSLDGPLDQGVTRACTIDAVGPFPAGELTEALSEFNREEKVLTYVIKTGGPPFLSHIQNRWILEARDATSSSAHSTITYRLEWWAMPFAPLIAMMMRKTLKPLLAQFRDAVQDRFLADPDAARQPLSQVG
jgi:hypothetical protein